MDNLPHTSLDMSGIFNEGQETLSELSQLSSSQFTNFDLEHVPISPTLESLAQKSPAMGTGLGYRSITPSPAL